MTDERQPTDCGDVRGLLQPFVDGEMTDAERIDVINHIDACVSCRTQVQHQQFVRGALRQLPSPTAPAALRSRVLAALDDAETAMAMAMESSPTTSSTATSTEFRAAGSGGRALETTKIIRFPRLRAFFRGGLVLAPAAAASVALFVYVRSSSTPSGPPAVDPSRVGAALTALPTASTPANDAAFEPLRLAARRDLPEGVEFVSSNQAEVRYRDRNFGFQVLDHQRKVESQRLSGTRHNVRGRPYHLSSDPEGRPRIEFQVHGVHHTLSFEEIPAQFADLPIDVDRPDFRTLIQLAAALEAEGARRRSLQNTAQPRR